MAQSIRGVFEQECKGLEIDTALVKRIGAYHDHFVTKNDQHIAFFGGNLLGVQIVRFNPADKDEWFEEIMQVVPGYLEEQLLALPTVNENFHVSSDTMNLSCAWMVHALYTSSHLSADQKHAAMVDVFRILQYKFFTSRLSRHFQYPARREVAEATYAQLSYKYALKQHGSWAALFLARAEELATPGSLHWNMVAKMDRDAEVVYFLNDTQGRIRDMLKNIYNLFLQVNAQGTRISTTTQVAEHDGESILKDKSKNLLSYGRYLNSVVSDKTSFIRDELAEVIEQLIYTMPPRLFRQTLGYISDNYRQARAGEIEEVLSEVLVHSFDYLSDNRSVLRTERDLPGLLTRLRGVYMSSRSTDPALLTLRQKTERIVRNATGNKNPSVIASVRTGVLLYLVARAFSMNYYSKH